jgi:hypothetical protein
MLSGTDRILPLNVRRATTVLEVVGSAVAHDVVLNSAKVDPDVRELVDEEGPAIQKLDPITLLPAVTRGPCSLAVVRQ